MSAAEELHYEMMYAKMKDIDESLGGESRTGLREEKRDKPKLKIRFASEEQNSSDNADSPSDESKEKVIAEKVTSLDNKNLKEIKNKEVESNNDDMKTKMKENQTVKQVEKIPENTFKKNKTPDQGKGDKSMSIEAKGSTLRFGFDEPTQRAMMKVIGIGGAGSNAVDNMIIGKLKGVDFIAINTDMQALDASHASTKIQIGKQLTQGLGAGGSPDIGRASAEESHSEIRDLLDKTDMVFITAGMGGGTGTGAAPIIASIAKERGVLTVAIVTKPFGFEGPKRAKRAEIGIEEMRDMVDALIIIPNDNILTTIVEDISFRLAFRKADEILYQGTKGISDIINTTGFVNLDFADAKAVMTDSGDAIMGLGEAEGEKRALEAAEAAITSPLLDNLSIEGAKGILINVTGNENMGMLEVQQAVNLVTTQAGENADVYFGIVHDESMGDKISVTVIATGFNDSGGRSMPITPVEEEIVTMDNNGFSRSRTKLHSMNRTKGNGKRNGNGNGNGNGYGTRPSVNSNDNNEKAEPQPSEVEDFDFDSGEFKIGDKPSIRFQRVESTLDDEILIPDIDENESLQTDGENYDMPTFLRRKRRFGN